MFSILVESFPLELLPRLVCGLVSKVFLKAILWLSTSGDCIRCVACDLQHLVQPTPKGARTLHLLYLAATTSGGDVLEPAAQKDPRTSSKVWSGRADEPELCILFAC